MKNISIFNESITDLYPEDLSYTIISSSQLEDFELVTKSMEITQTERESISRVLLNISKDAFKESRVLIGSDSIINYVGKINSIDNKFFEIDIEKFSDEWWVITTCAPTKDVVNENRFIFLTDQIIGLKKALSMIIQTIEGHYSTNVNESLESIYPEDGSFKQLSQADLKIVEEFLPKCNMREDEVELIKKIINNFHKPIELITTLYPIVLWGSIKKFDNKEVTNGIFTINKLKDDWWLFSYYGIDNSYDHYLCDEVSGLTKAFNEYLESFEISLNRLYETKDIYPEDILNESIQYPEDGSFKKISMKDFDDISHSFIKVFRPSDATHTRVLNEINIIFPYSRITTTTRSNALNINIGNDKKIVTVTISQYEDSWWTLLYFNGNRYVVYLCDELTGLVKALKDYKIYYDIPTIQVNEDIKFPDDNSFIFMPYVNNFESKFKPIDFTKHEYHSLFNQIKRDIIPKDYLEGNDIKVNDTDLSVIYITFDYQNPIIRIHKLEDNYYKVGYGSKIYICDEKKGLFTCLNYLKSMM